MASDLEELRALAELSPQLVAAAERQDWDALTELGNHYFAHFGLLARAPQNDGDTSERARLIRQLLDDQQAIRDQAEPWLRSTGKLLGCWEKIDARQTGTVAAPLP